MKRNTLSEIKNDMIKKGAKASVGSTNNVYGKIEGETLFFKGKYYKLNHVNPECLILDTNELFGKYGDEFPLDMVR